MLSWSWDRFSNPEREAVSREPTAGLDRKTRILPKRAEMSAIRLNPLRVLRIVGNVHRAIADEMDYHCNKPVVVYQAIGSVFDSWRAVGQGDGDAHVSMGVRMAKIEPIVRDRRLGCRARQIMHLTADERK